MLTRVPRLIPAQQLILVQPTRVQQLILAPGLTLVLRLRALIRVRLTLVQQPILVRLTPAQQQLIRVQLTPVPEASPVHS